MMVRAQFPRHNEACLDPMPLVLWDKQRNVVIHLNHSVAHIAR